MIKGIKDHMHLTLQNHSDSDARFLIHRMEHVIQGRHAQEHFLRQLVHMVIGAI